MNYWCRLAGIGVGDNEGMRLVPVGLVCLFVGAGYSIGKGGGG